MNLKACSIKKIIKKTFYINEFILFITNTRSTITLFLSVLNGLLNYILIKKKLSY